MDWSTVMQLETTFVINHSAAPSSGTCPPVSGDELRRPAAPASVSTQQETVLDWPPLII